MERATNGDPSAARADAAVSGVAGGAGSAALVGTIICYAVGEFDFQHCPNCHVRLFVPGLGSTIMARAVSVGTVDATTGLYHNATSRYTCTVCRHAYIVTFEPGVPMAGAS